MRNKFMLILLALASVAVIASYDFGEEYQPYNAIDYAVPEKPSKNKIKKNKSQAKKQTTQNQPLLDPMKKMRLELAVVSAKAGAQCGFSSGAGYRHLNPDEAAKELVIVMNSASQPGSSMQTEQAATTGIPIMYVLDAATAPWQVVVRADLQSNLLYIEGYGTDLSHPVFHEAVTCQ